MGIVAWSEKNVPGGDPWFNTLPHVPGRFRWEVVSFGPRARRDGGIALLGAALEALQDPLARPLPDFMPHSGRSLIRAVEHILTIDKKCVVYTT